MNVLKRFGKPRCRVCAMLFITKGLFEGISVNEYPAPAGALLIPCCNDEA